MKVSEMYGGEYLAATDLSNGPVEGKIVACGTAVFQKGKKDESIKLAITVEGIVKQIAINKTSAKLCVAAWGDDSDDWLGQRVRVRPVEMMVADKLTQVIIVSPAPAEKKSAK